MARSRRSRLDRLRSAAEVRAAHPWVNPTERRRRERRLQLEVLDLLDAVKSGDEIRAYPRPLTPAEEGHRDEALAFLDDRREAIKKAAVALFECGVENDLTDGAVAAGLLPEDPEEYDDE